MASHPPSKPTHLEPSPLGTKEYWNTLYTSELSNHTHDPSDVGTIWFSDSSAEEKMLSFLQDPALGLSFEQTSFLDVGTGNGHFLVSLRRGRVEEEEDEEDDEEEEEEEEEEDERQSGQENGDNRIKRGFKGRMLGTDYSPQSISLAKQIVGSESEQDRDIEFRLWDIIRDSPVPTVLDGENEEGWDVVLDKGTFDAISLSDEKLDDGRRICELYRDKIIPLVRMGGFFLVTSCNWTEEELRRWFEGDENEESGEEKPRFKYWDRIVYPSFSFGGQKGQTISSVCFRKEMKGKR